ncbi:MAG: hypothetical protein AAGH40_13300 [Verrucomicrobiota bacterium]
MKKFIFGFLAGIASTLIVLFGLFVLLGQEVEKRLYGPWEEKEETELEFTFHPSEDIELSDSLGMNASELSDFLSQGNEEKKRSYLSVFESGLKTEIISEFESEGPDRTQSITFKNGKTGNHIHELVSEVELIRDIPAESTISLPELEMKVIEELRARAEEQQARVIELQDTKTD